MNEQQHTYQPGDRIRVRCYGDHIIPKWMHNMEVVVVRINRTGKPVVRLDNWREDESIAIDPSKHILRTREVPKVDEQLDERVNRLLAYGVPMNTGVWSKFTDEQWEAVLAIAEGAHSAGRVAAARETVAHLRSSFGF